MRIVLNNSKSTKYSQHNIIKKTKGGKALPSYRKYGTEYMYQHIHHIRKNAHKDANTNPVTLLRDPVCDPISYSNSLNPHDTSLLDKLSTVYKGNIGYDIDHLDQLQYEWLTKRIESDNRDHLSNDAKRDILKTLIHSEQFDLFLQNKFPHVKRYSLEGNESFIVMMDALLKECSKEYSDCVITLPHRGRLNLLCNLLQYPYEQLFSRLQGRPTMPEDVIGTDDVLSHLAQSIDLDYSDSSVHVSLIHNPSHLEASTAVVLGKARAKQIEMNDQNGDNVLPVMIHGDAAVSGQGIIYETMTLSGLPGYTAGGAFHIVVNNQIGFTTQRNDGRATTYCTDIAKAYGVPVFHVNSSHPEDVIYATKLALEFRSKFKKDVFVDLIGWRKHGHNEVDEPAFTQPTLYKWIKEQKSNVTPYQNQLISEGIISAQDVNEIKNEFKSELENHLTESANFEPTIDHLRGKWNGYVQPKDITETVETGFDLESLKEIGNVSINFEDAKVHQRLVKMYAEKRKQSLEAKSIDWSTAEALAIGSLLSEGFDVRISGQDVGRGTFSHRHCVITCQDTGKKYIPFNNITPQKEKKGTFFPVNSFLSEFGVLGYEYGYSVESPQALVMWEAQFGDFFNGAQIIFDQFISSGEDKWFRQSGLTVLLPHGYEATGPEHSSCRLERFLQMTNTDYLSYTDASKRPGMRIVLPTTPANCFHMLRRQMKSNYRKPLIVAAPKSILRHKYSLSNLSEFGPGTHFVSVIGDPVAEKSISDIRNVILCSGKAAFDLMDTFSANDIKNTAVIRIEELVPFPAENIAKELSKYGDDVKLIWYQEEPQNMGAFTFMEPRLRNYMNKQVHYIGQPPMNSVSEGTPSRHKKVMDKVASQLLDFVKN